MKKVLIWSVCLIILVPLVFLNIGCGATEEAVTSVVEEAEEETESAVEEVTEEVTKEPQTLIISTTYDCEHVDPHAYYDMETFLVQEEVYEGLIAYAWDSTDIVGVLAESWEIDPDFTEFTFHLREGVTFHDGTQFNADAVLINYERQKELNEGPAWMLCFVDSVEKIDDYTVKINTVESSPNFLHYLAGSWCILKMISPTAIKDNEVDGDYAQAWLRENEVGTGPYMLDEWTRDQQYVLVKNDDYWKGWEDSPNNIEKVILKIVTEPNTQRLLLEKGDIDIVFGHLSNEAYSDLEQNDEVTVKSFPGSSIYLIWLNAQQEQLSDKKVRQALSYALNYDVIINDIYGLGGRRLLGVITEAFAGTGPDLPIYTYDLEKAKELLGESEYPDGGFSLEFYYQPGFDEHRRLAEIYQSDLAELGIGLEIFEKPWGTLGDMYMSPDTAPDMFIAHMIPDNLDAYGILNVMLNSEMYFPNGSNIGYYNNPDMDALLASLQYEGDTDKIEEIAKQVNTLALEDAPDIWILSKDDIIAWRNNVKNLVYSGLKIFTVNLYEMWKE